MPWYYCSNHPKPLLFTCPFDRPCANCGQPLVLANNTLRYSKPNDYDIRWHEMPNGVALRLELGNYRVLLTDDVLPYDTVNFSPTMNLKPPGGGQWFGQLSTYGGGRRYNSTDNGMVPSSLNQTAVKLGQNDSGSAFGLAHVLKGHAQMLNDLRGFPPRQPNTFDLTNFRDNLRALTAPKSQASGIRWVAKQLNNNRYVLHGVTNGQHGMLIVDQQYKLITGYGGQNMSGLGQAPSRIREW